MLFGFLNVNKPAGMTSHDVISVLRRVSSIKQIGHTGTLDPMAQGVLPVAIGKASRLIEYLNENNKEYAAEIQFGKISDTYDTEGKITEYSKEKVDKAQIKNCLEKFLGEIEQIPPAHSAVHYKGKRLYELARKGIIPDDIPKRKVYISKCELIEFDYEKQKCKIDIACSKGTYIRSIVNDLGIMLKCGGVMTALTRTASGIFKIENSVKLDEIKTIKDIENYLINPIDVLSYKCYALSEIELQKVEHGQSLSTKEFSNGEMVCLTYKNKLCAISQKTNDRLITKKVFIL